MLIDCQSIQLSHSSNIICKKWTEDKLQHSLEIIWQQQIVHLNLSCTLQNYCAAGSLDWSNPAHFFSPCSSAVEHSLGKGEVSGSSPDEGIVGGTSKRFNRNQETSKGLFFNANSLLILESLLINANGNHHFKSKEQKQMFPFCSCFKTQMFLFSQLIFQFFSSNNWPPSPSILLIRRSRKPPCPCINH